MAHTDHDQHFMGAVAQKALIEQDGKILMVQYPDDDHAAAGKWDLPGGRLHVGESALQGLKREVQEETGLEVEVVDIVATGVFTVLHNRQQFFVIYRARLLNPSQALVAEPGEIEKIEWRAKSDFFTLPLCVPAYAEALRDILRI